MTSLNLNRIKRQVLSRVGFARFVIIASIVILVAILLIIFQNPTSNLFNHVNTQTFTPLPQHQGRTNILILGIGGAGHDAPNLTDTIIFASFNSETGEPTLISLPRDIWIPSIQAKINTAYHYGLEKSDINGGLQLAKSSTSEIVNQPVHFVAIIDFSTFQKFIDTIGGIDVNVEKSFDDYLYPIPGKENDTCQGDPEFKCRYEHIRFDAGVVHMDGQTALKFVRSRHAQGEEGSDFARSRRQERVIQAVKAKLISLELIKNPSLYKKVYNLLSQSITTDIKSQYYYSLFQLALKAKDQQIKSYGISEPGQLYHPPISPLYGNQWVLIPRNNDPKIVHDYVQDLLRPPSSK